MVPNSAAASARGVTPYNNTAPTQSTATTASMIGYCEAIGSRQWRHRPLSSSHDTTGMLSRQAMGCLQRGQADGGRSSDRSFGSRTMQTLRKLPTQRPTTAAPTTRIGSTTTRHLVEEDARRHRDVERLGALRERDGHALRGDGVELRADASAFVPDDHRDGPRALHPPAIA